MAVAVQSTSAEATASGGSLELNAPSGVVSGDLLIAQVTTDRVSGSGAAISGWTEIHQTNSDNDASGGGELVTFSRVATGTEDYTVTFSDAGESIGFVARIDGQRTNSPVAQSSEQANNTASTTATGATITPTTTNSLILICVGTGSTATTSGYAITTSDPGGWTEAWDGQSTVSVAMAYDIRPEVTGTGDATATLSSSTKSLVHVIAIAPDIVIDVPVTSVTVSHPALTQSSTQTTAIPVTSVTVSHPALAASQDDKSISNKTKNSATFINKTKNNI